MKSFFLKYRGRIIYWVIFLFIILIFAPAQRGHYLDVDIKAFKEIYFIPVLIWTWVAICVIFLFILFIKTKSFEDSSLSFLSIAITTAFIFFIFQDIFLAGTLFVNRQFKQDSFQKPYIAKYMVGAEKNKDNFIPYDPSLQQISIDKKLIDKLFHPGLEQDDTIQLKFYNGLFGIKYPMKN